MLAKTLGAVFGNWQRLAVYGALMLAAGGTVWMHGFFKGKQYLFEERAKAATQAIKLVIQRGGVTEKVVIRYVKVRARARVVERVVHEEVVRYVEKNPTVCLDPEWGVLHDAAANRSVPDPASGTDAKGRAPKAAEALVTVTQNYEEHHACVDKLDALQEWIREQQKVNAD